MAHSQDAVADAEPDCIASWSSTQVRTIKLRHAWSINPFFFFEDLGSVRSPRFGTGTHDALEWTLELRPDGNGREHPGYVSAFLRLESCDKDHVQAGCLFYLFDKHRVRIGKPRSFRPHEFKEGDSWGIGRLISRYKLIQHLDDFTSDELIVVCEVTVTMDIVEISDRDPDAFETMSRNKSSRNECVTVCEKMYTKAARLQRHREIKKTRNVPSVLGSDPDVPDDDRDGSPVLFSRS